MRHHCREELYLHALGRPVGFCLLRNTPEQLVLLPSRRSVRWEREREYDWFGVHRFVQTEGTFRQVAVVWPLGGTRVESMWSSVGVEWKYAFMTPFKHLSMTVWSQFPPLLLVDMICLCLPISCALFCLHSSILGLFSLYIPVLTCISSVFSVRCLYCREITACTTVARPCLVGQDCSF